jgi:SAM-dependent methyltransferase
MPSIDQNIEKWDHKFRNFIEDEDYGYRWSEAWGGPLLQWYSTIFPRIERCLPAKHIYEIGSGLGRWSEFLKHYCKYLTLSDICEQSFEFLSNKYENEERIVVIKTNGTQLNSESKIDFLFSFDSLVHSDFDVISSYIKEYKEKSSHKSFFFFHHSNLESCSRNVIENMQNGWRSKNVSSMNVRDKVLELNLNLVHQELIDWGSVREHLDCLTLISPMGTCISSQVDKNKSFMLKAKKVNECKDKLNRIYNLIYSFRCSKLIPLTFEKRIILFINKIYGI